MTDDDLIAFLASKPKRHRPTELKSDSAMLAAWIACRSTIEFRNDVIFRHGLDKLPAYHLVATDGDPSMDHAISNAWGWLVESAIKRNH